MRKRLPVGWIISGGVHALVLLGGAMGLGLVPAPRVLLKHDPLAIRSSFIAPVEAQAQPVSLATAPVELDEAPEALPNLLTVTYEAPVDSDPGAVIALAAGGQASGVVVRDANPSAFRFVPRQRQAAPSTPSEAGAAPQPRVLEEVKPDYPNRCRHRGEEGTVQLVVAIDQTGHPVQVSVATSSGHPLLDEAAIQAVQRWRFSPDNPGSTTVTIEFRLG